jgi:hypothetical protein
MGDEAMPRKKRDDPTAISPTEWLDEYAYHLHFFLCWMDKYGRSEHEEADIVLFTREDLAQALRAHRDGLTKEQRKRLRELDNLLKANAKLIAKALPDLPRLRQRLKPPRHHWWWWLDRLAQQQASRHKIAPANQSPPTEGQERRARWGS